VHSVHAQQLHAECGGGRVGRAGAVPFLHEWSAFTWESCMWRKIAATPAAACSRESAAGACETEGAGRAGGCSTMERVHRRR
jgi:hypothetical protein